MQTEGGADERRRCRKLKLGLRPARHASSFRHGLTLVLLVLKYSSLRKQEGKKTKKTKQIEILQIHLLMAQPASGNKNKRHLGGAIKRSFNGGVTASITHFGAEAAT